MANENDLSRLNGEYIEKMGAELGSLYTELSEECVWLNNLWNQYVQLYGTSQERLDILEFAAEHFFYLVQKAFFEGTLLNLSRITDPTEMGWGKSKRENVTVKRLPKLVELRILPEVESRLQSIDADVEFARDWRNRRIAHADWHLAITGTAKPLEPVTRKQVEAAISAIGELLNFVQEHYVGSTTAFGHLTAHGQADDLLEALNVVYVQEQEFQSRLSSDTLTSEDLIRRSRNPI